MGLHKTGDDIQSLEDLRYDESTVDIKSIDSELHRRQVRQMIEERLERKRLKEELSDELDGEFDWNELNF